MHKNIFKSLVITGFLLLLPENYLNAQIMTEEDETEQDSIAPLGIQQAALNMYDNYFTVSAASPTVAELMKYVDIPVDPSTGVPNIQIPLYELHCGDITLPITLSYHAGGIKIDQIASWVGLGWNLSAGGAINCVQIDGRANSFDCARELYNQAQMKEFVEVNSNFNVTVSALERWMDKKAVPDIFNYNFMGYSGKLFAYNNKLYDIHGSKEIEFNKLYPAGDTKKATDLKGREYEFSDLERSTTYSRGLTYNEQSKVWEHMSANTGKKSPVNYSYMLSKVTSASKKDYITFTYRDETESFKGMTTGALSSRSGSSWGARQSDLGGSSSAFTIADTYSETKKIKEIKASNGISIVFTADIVRKDIVKNPFRLEDGYPNALKEIIIYDANGQQIRKWKFHYDYFTSTIKHPKNEYAHLRLKLTKLEEYGKDTNTPLVYNFAYYGEAAGEPTMPFRGAFGGRDFLGYCNATPGKLLAESVSQSFPKASKNSPLLGGFLPGNVEFSGGGDLNTKPEHVHAYSLKSLTYPTGGKRVFEYEPHQLGLYHYGGLRIKKILNYSSSTEYTTQEYDYGSGYVNTPVTMFRQRSRDSFAGNIPVRITPTSSSLPLYDVYSSPETQLSSYTGDGMKYSIVREYIGDSKIEYTYSSNGGREWGFPAEYSCYRAIVLNDGYQKSLIYRNDNYNKDDHNIRFHRIAPDYKQGHLVSKTTFAEDGLVIYETYEYEFEDKDIIPIVQCTYGGKEWCLEGYMYYDIIASSYVTGKARLVKKTVDWCKSSLSNDRYNPYMTQEEIYTYNVYDKPTSTQTKSSKGETILTTIRYASDINSSIYNSMKALKMIDYPVEEVKKVNGKAVEATLMTYKNEKNMYLPAKIYELRATAPLSSFSNFSGTVGSWYGGEVADIKNYTSKGKIAHIVNKEKMDVVYLWGYNHMYPIAEVRNATYADVVKIINETDMETIANKYKPSDSDWEKIEKLRGLAPTAQVTITRYKPLIGAELLTGPDLRPISFDYNNHGQLKEKYYMNSGKKEVIESYDYNYKNK